MEMKTIKKALMQGQVRLTSHLLKRIDKRGYMKSDIIACIMSGERTRLQPYKNKVCAVVEGVDRDGLPMVVVIGHDFTGKALFTVVTAMPPIEEKFHRVI